MGEGAEDPIAAAVETRESVCIHALSHRKQGTAFAHTTRLEPLKDSAGSIQCIQLVSSRFVDISELGLSAALDAARFAAGSTEANTKQAHTKQAHTEQAHAKHARVEGGASTEEAGAAAEDEAVATTSYIGLQTGRGRAYSGSTGETEGAMSQRSDDMPSLPRAISQLEISYLLELYEGH